MKYSLIITAWREPKSISLNINNILNPQSRNLIPDLEILVIAPDVETFKAAKSSANKFNFPNIKWIKDKGEGKPKALNLGIKNSSGEVLIFMDGDVIIGNDSLKRLVSGVHDDIWLCSGRPISSDSKATLFGYWGHLLADGANSKRQQEIEKGSSYFVSGYLYALKKFDGLLFPENILVDDGWISVKILEMNKRIGYSSNSIVYIKYPQNISDWFKQKRRSAGGYSQLTQFYTPQLKRKLPKRDFLEELKYLLFPVFYSRSILQFIYSLLLYPARLLLWILISFDKLTGRHNDLKLWVRIETTK